MALFVLQGAMPALAAEDAHRAAVDEALAKWKAGGHSRPIVETHIHFWQVTRPGGVPWPTPAEGPIYRDVLPAEYSAFARSHGVVAAGVVEASGIVEDNQWVLDRIKGDGLYSFYVGNLEIGATTFAHDLARFARDPRWVGIRGYLTGPAEGITLSPAQLANLRDLARRGMTLDIISRERRTRKTRCRRCVPPCRTCASSSTTSAAPRDHRRSTRRGNSRFAGSPTSARICT
jgi:predicted TIM-barrel fold metal-dependent hydrolase